MWNDGKVTLGQFSSEHITGTLYVGCFSHVQLCNPVDCSLPGSSVHGILRQEYRSGLLCPSPGDLPDSGIKPASPVSPAIVGGIFTTSGPQEALSEMWGLDDVLAVVWIPTKDSGAFIIFLWSLSSMGNLMASEAFPHSAMCTFSPTMKWSWI